MNGHHYSKISRLAGKAINAVMSSSAPSSGAPFVQKAIELPVKATKSSSKFHIDRLDSIRFLAALWVAISHGAIPLKPLPGEHITRVMLTVVHSFSGIAAVMVFFIVSGLCIHLPYSGGKTVPVLHFLIRRYLRVGLPLLAVLVIAHLLGGQSQDGLATVVWSVYAELFYYSIYPLMFWLARRFGWTSLIGYSLLLSICVSIYFGVTYIPDLGWLAWLWGLPIWLSGCLLADHVRERKFPHIPASLWVWRAMAWGLSVFSTYLIFHSPIKIGYPFSMLVFSLIAYGWLLKELQSPITAWAPLERCGAASYSLYLVHNVVLGGLSEHMPPLGRMDELLSRVLSIALITYIFYQLIEAPSHRLARQLANAVTAARSRAQKPVPRAEPSVVKDDRI